MKQNLILASNSPRRKELLKLLNVEFRVITRKVPEEYPPDLPVEEVPKYLALKKSQAYQDLIQNNIVLTADTVVILNKQIIGKPTSLQNAKELLAKLSGNKHIVITGVCLAHKNIKKIFSETTEVHFKKLSPQEINYYVEKYKPLDKAGAYAIQEWIGAIAITKIIGDVYNVIGLPIRKVYEELKNINN